MCANIFTDIATCLFLDVSVPSDQPTDILLTTTSEGRSSLPLDPQTSSQRGEKRKIEE